MFSAETTKHDVKWLSNQNKRGRLNKDISIQRKEVWDQKRKGDLIVSVLLNVPIESLLLEEEGNNPRKMSYKVLDGKQRIITLCAYIDDVFALPKNIILTHIDGVKISGLRFSELPEEFRNSILDYELHFSVLGELDPESRSKVFFLRNQAVKLSNMDLLPSLIGDDAMDKFNSILQHSFIKNKVKPSPSMVRKREDLKILLYYMILASRKDMGFSGIEVLSFGDAIGSNEIDICVDEFNTVFNYMDKVLPEGRPYLKPVHTPIILYVAQFAAENGMKPEDFRVRLDDFFLTEAKTGEYKEACIGGSAKKINIQKRLEIMQKTILG